MASKASSLVASPSSSAYQYVLLHNEVSSENGDSLMRAIIASDPETVERLVLTDNYRDAKMDGGRTPYDVAKFLHIKAKKYCQPKDSKSVAFLQNRTRVLKALEPVCPAGTPLKTLSLLDAAKKHDPIYLQIALHKHPVPVPFSKLQKTLVEAIHFVGEIGAFKIYDKLLQALVERALDPSASAEEFSVVLSDIILFSHEALFFTLLPKVKDDDLFSVTLCVIKKGTVAMISSMLDRLDNKVSRGEKRKLYFALKTRIDACVSPTAQQQALLSRVMPKD
jgi:hypothetical protein